MTENVKRMITEAINDEYSYNTLADHCAAFTSAVNCLMGYYSCDGSVPMDCLEYASEYSKSKWFQS